jgi:hypothetical protein
MRTDHLNAVSINRLAIGNSPNTRSLESYVIAAHFGWKSPNFDAAEI